MSKTIRVRIVADTRELRKELIRAQLLVTEGVCNRGRLRFVMWRISREGPPS